MIIMATTTLAAASQSDKLSPQIPNTISKDRSDNTGQLIHTIIKRETEDSTKHHHKTEEKSKHSRDK